MKLLDGTYETDCKCSEKKRSSGWWNICMNSFDERNENKALAHDVGFECSYDFGNESLEIASGGCQIGMHASLSLLFKGATLDCWCATTEGGA
jgi:hypothetical protein